MVVLEGLSVLALIPRMAMVVGRRVRFLSVVVGMRGVRERIVAWGHVSVGGIRGMAAILAAEAGIVVLDVLEENLGIQLGVQVMEAILADSGMTLVAEAKSGGCC